MEPRLTDGQLEAALNDQLGLAFADHAVVAFFRDGKAAFNAIESVTPTSALSEFLEIQLGDEERTSGSQTDSTAVETGPDSFVPIIESASVVKPTPAKVEAQTISPSRVGPVGLGSSTQPSVEDGSLWAPMFAPVFDEDRAFPETPYELSNHENAEPNAAVNWMDANHDSHLQTDLDTSEVLTFRSAGRRTAVLAAIVAAIVGGAQATGTTDLLPRRVVEMAAGHEAGVLHEGRKPSDPPPGEIGDSDNDHIEPLGDDTPVDLGFEAEFSERIGSESQIPNPNLDQPDDQGGTV